MADNYDLARQICEAASQDPFVLPAYTGGTSDLQYLRSYVLNAITSIYHVDASIFDTPTVLSTTILRDFVHRALEQTLTPNDINTIAGTPQFQGWGDVALGFRYPAWGLCGFMSWQMYEVYRSFGYLANDISSINGDIQNWTDGHVETQVYVTDLNKWIVQDSTFNFIYRDNNGNILSFFEAEQNNLSGNINFDGFNMYTYYYRTGSASNISDPSMQSTGQYILNNYLKGVYWWYSADGQQAEKLPKLFLDPSTAHDPASFQGAEFAQVADASAAITGMAASGSTWQQIAANLRGQSYYVTGFELTDGANNVASQWLTVRLTSGDYVSINIASGSILYGSYDQLTTEAATPGSAGPNAGTDLSAFLRPVYLLSLTGTLMTIGDPNLILGTSSPSVLDGRGKIAELIGYSGQDLFLIDNPSTTIGELKPGNSIVQSWIDYSLPSNCSALYLEGTATTAKLSPGTSGTLYGNPTLASTLDARGGTGTLVGQSGNDTFFIDDATDTVVEAVAGGHSTVYASANFTLPVNVSVMNLYGSATIGSMNATGNGWIYGNSALASTLYAMGSGIAHLVGRSGNDTFFIDNAADGVQETVAGGNSTVYAYDNFTLPTNCNVMNLYGSATVGRMNATGNGWIYGNSAHASTLYAMGSGIGHLVGQSGNDTFFIDNAADGVQETVAGGNSTVYAYDNFTLPTNCNVMNLKGSATVGRMNATGNGWIYGNSALASTLYAMGSGIAHLVGQSGNDTFLIDNAADGVQETVAGGNSTVYAYDNFTLPTNCNVMNLYGSATVGRMNATGNGWIYGNSALASTLYAMGSGIGHLVGQSGNDTFFIDNAADGVQETVAGGNSIVYAYDSFTLPTNCNVMNLKGSATVGRMNATGNGWIYGNSALASTLYAMGSGIGHLTGQSGNDTFFIDNAADSAQETVAGGNSRVYAYDNFTLPTNCNVMNLKGSATVGRMNATGNGWIYGNSTLASSLYAMGSGIGHLTGQSGNDTFFIDNAADKVQETVAGGNSTVYADVNFTLPTNCNALYIEGSATTGTGNSQAHSIYANNLGDTLISGSGVAYLYGGAGNDTFYINNSADTVSDTAGTNTVWTTVSYQLSQGAQAATLETANANAASPINLTGNGLQTAIIGNAGNNVIDGGGGSPTLTGGGGADTFVMSSLLGAPTITDFDPANDILQLSHTAFGLSGTGALATAGIGFTVDASSSTSSPALLYDTNTGSLWWEPAGNATLTPTLLATLSNHITLSASNIVIG